jgi:hypothetical protein
VPGSRTKDRRWVVRWERIAACFEAFLAIATIHIWMHRLVVGYIRSIFPYTGRCREGDRVPFLVGARYGQTVCSGDLCSCSHAPVRMRRPHEVAQRHELRFTHRIDEGMQLGADGLWGLALVGAGRRRVVHVEHPIL